MFIGVDEMGKFKIHSKYRPTGDQPAAIDSLVQSINRGDKCQTLLGVTGSPGILPSIILE